MNKQKKARKGYVVFVAIISLIVMMIGLSATKNIGRTAAEIERENAIKQLSRMVSEIDPEWKMPGKAVITSEDRANVARELPDISTCEVVVEPTSDNYIEIYSSPEKAGEGTDGWLTELGKRFNRDGGVVIGDKVYSVLIRKVNSGEAVDYISSGKAVPDAFTPSNDLWKLMLEADGVATHVISDSMVPNTAGLCVNKDVYKELSEFGEGDVDLETIIDATSYGEITTGYTNPFASSAGLNLLVSILMEYGEGDIFSDGAKYGFNLFQTYVPYVALNTMQMRESADNGTFDAFVCEYQTYVNDKTMSSDYTFVPYGYAHNNPLISVTDDSERNEALRAFSDYCSSESAMKLASDYGFVKSNYHCDYAELSGDELRQAQRFYKENKNSSPVVCVFVTDVSGSMLGEPLSALQQSLINAMQYINNNNYIGIVSYSDNVTIELPIAEFDSDQQAYFKGAVQSLRASGGTATFDGVCVALDMIEEQLEITPDATPIIFVLSDGETNTGYHLDDVSSIVKKLKVPIYTIGYNANIDALSEISDINEGTCINADTDNVMYQVKLLFNSSL